MVKNYYLVKIMCLKNKFEFHISINDYLLNSLNLFNYSNLCTNCLFLPRNKIIKYIHIFHSFHCTLITWSNS